jgi:hypothetical protein
MAVDWAVRTERLMDDQMADMMAVLTAARTAESMAAPRAALWARYLAFQKDELKVASMAVPRAYQKAVY